ncbi:MAG TPA: MATE family efflux transporter, partial [Candidatus Faecivivens stercoravium]|nr:MATE family efflux transporter [Candidatus Faecivivens stercoravium]
MPAKATLMTEGSIEKHLISFAVPLFLGNLFQQLYNTADSLIVGNFLGSEALASVSSSSNLIFLMIGFFNGIAVGAGVVIARAFGAGDKKALHTAIHTTIAFGLVAGVVLTLLGVLLAPQILVWMGTPESILAGSVSYFRIYFLGSVPFVLYNICVGILQSVGDSRHPLYYLMVSSVVNILLDLLFVAGFKMGVGSAAAATAISQLVSAALCFIRLCRTDDVYRVTLRDIRFDIPMLGKIIRNGLPAGCQNSIIAFANVIVQTNINAFGEIAVAGQGVYAKIEGFGFLPITCFAMALTTFISQNLGAGEYDRAKKGARFGILCSMAIAEIIGLAIFLGAPFLMWLFDRNPDVIASGVGRAQADCLFYFLLAFSHCIAGIMRGAGKASVPMVVMLISWCVIRVAYITVAIRFIPSIQIIYWAYPITWAISSVIFLVYF